MWSRFQIGSKIRLAKRMPAMFWTVCFSRKWSTRWIACSGAAVASSSFSARAEARSCPKGFSTTMALPSGSPAAAMALMAAGNTGGGSARYTTAGPSPSASAAVSAAGSPASPCT